MQAVFFGHQGYLQISCRQVQRASGNAPGEGAPVNAHASGGKPDEVAAAVAEARAAGQQQRDDEDMDAVRRELDEAGEDHTHLSASKERRLAARGQRDTVRHRQVWLVGCGPRGRCHGAYAIFLPTSKRAIVMSIVNLSRPGFKRV